MSVKRKFYTTVFVFILFIAGVVFFVLWPNTKEILRLSHLINNERAELERKYQSGQRLNETIQALEKIRQQKLILDSVFVAEGAEADFSSELEQLAENYRISQELQAQAPQNNQFSLSQKLFGNYANVLDYLAALESLTVYMNTKQFNMSVAGVNNVNNISMSLKTESFILPQ